MRKFPLSVRELGPWVVGYALFGFGPRAIVPYLPVEFLQQTIAVSGDRSVSLGDVALWLPNMLAGASVVTLLVGILCAVGQYAMEGVGQSVGELFQQLRFGASIAGVMLIVLFIIAIWVSIFQNAIIEWIDLVIFGVATGTGLATGTAYYTDDEPQR